MIDLSFFGGNNIAGTYLVRYVPVVGVASLPVPSSGEVTGSPIFADGFRWYTIYGTQDTKSYEEQEEETDNGPLWTLSVGLFLPGDSPALRSALANLAFHRFILECQDNVGLWRRVGTITEFMQLKYKFGVDPAASGRRGYSLTFSGTLTSCPPLVSGQ